MRHPLAAASPRAAPRAAPSPSPRRRARQPSRPPALTVPRAEPSSSAHAGDGHASLDTHAASHAAAADAVPPRPRLVGALTNDSSLDDRISSGEFTDAGSTKERATRPVRKLLAKDRGGPGRAFALWLAQLGLRWRATAASRMPTATGDIREIVGQPVFVPLYRLFLTYGPIFRLAFGPKSFIVVSDPDLAKQVLLTDASSYTKGLLSEILDFVMGTGLIPADGDVWRERRRAIVPALHRKYIASMLGMFGECALHGARTLEKKVDQNQPVEMENFFSRLTLDIIGKAVFNYDFDSLTTDDPFIQAVYTALREAEYRSTAFVPYWNFAPLRWLVPRQRACGRALKIINDTLDGLIDKCQKLVDTNDEQFEEEFLSAKDPSILHFLLASGDSFSSKQLRDDLMTLLIAGHETTAAVLTWTFYCLAHHRDIAAAVAAEVDDVLGDRAPTVDDMPRLRLTTRVINEAMRLYPQPPVLIRRAAVDTELGGYTVEAGADMFISVWNLHRSPRCWDRPDEFDPMRFGPLDGPLPNETTVGYQYLPFGGGKRKCVGDVFALYEAVAALAVLSRRFEFDFDESAPRVGMTTGATIHTSEGLVMKVTRRRVGGGGVEGVVEEVAVGA